MNEETSPEVHVFKLNGYGEVKLSRTRITDSYRFIDLKDIDSIGNVKMFEADYRNSYPKLDEAGKEPETPTTEREFYEEHYENRKNNIPFFVFTNESNFKLISTILLIALFVISIGFAAVKSLFAVVFFCLFLAVFAIHNWVLRTKEDFYKEYQKYYEELSSKHNLWKLKAYSVEERIKIKPAQARLSILLKPALRNRYSEYDYTFLSNLEEGQKTSEVLVALREKIVENIMSLKD